MDIASTQGILFYYVKSRNHTNMRWMALTTNFSSYFITFLLNIYSCPYCPSGVIMQGEDHLQFKLYIALSNAHALKLLIFNYHFQFSALTDIEGGKEAEGV